MGLVTYSRAKYTWTIFTLLWLLFNWNPSFPSSSPQVPMRLQKENNVKYWHIYYLYNYNKWDMSQTHSLFLLNWNIAWPAMVI